MVLLAMILTGRGYVFYGIAGQCVLLSKMGLQCAWKAINFSTSPPGRIKEMLFYFSITDAFRATS